MKNSEKLMNEIINKIPDAVVIVNSSADILYLNDSAIELTGINNADIQLNEILENLDISMMDSELITYKTNLRTFENDVLSVRVNINKSNELYFITIIPLKDLSLLNQAHTDFVSTVSHELRTPLTSIKGFVDTLINSGNMLNEEQKKRFLMIIKDQIERLNRLVENLLTVSRLECKSDKSILKSVNLSQFVDNVLQIIQPKAEDHKFIKNININLPNLLVDTDKLEQVFVNLLDNAVKYSYSQSSIFINAEIYKKNDNFILIEIEDEGVGIPEDKLDKIFTKFSRIDNPLTRQVQGTGLGLYIIKTLIDSMGGKIFAKRKNNGTIFSVILPVATPENIITRENLC